MDTHPAGASFSIRDQALPRTQQTTNQSFIFRRVYSLLPNLLMGTRTIWHLARKTVRGNLPFFWHRNPSAGPEGIFFQRI